MKESTWIARIFYQTVIGRLLIRLIQISHAEWLIILFLSSPLSRPLVALHIRRYGIPSAERLQRPFHSYREFFARSRRDADFDAATDHLISPCDGWLSACPIQADSSFSIKGSHYRLEDLLGDRKLAQNYHGGDCLIFRLCLSDYHRYCYIDDGYQGKHHYIQGVLHSVQPVACEKYPVFVLNRRCWSLLTTEHFGPVVQTEVGALLVGGILNQMQNTRFCKGMEKGRFELAGSTITLLFEKDRICLREDLMRRLETEGEVRVCQGMWIGDRRDTVEERK